MNLGNFIGPKNIIESIMPKCKLCDYKPRSFYHLKQHMFIHNNERRMCDICGKSYSNDINLSAHKRRVHLNPYTFFVQYKGVDIKCERCKKLLVKIEKHMSEHN